MRRKSLSRQAIGFSMLEVLFTLAIFATILLMFGATFPQTFHNTGQSSNFLQASLLARHKVEQLRQAGYNHFVGTDLAQLGIIDSATTASDGSYSFGTVDHLTDSGTTKGYFGAATNATGKIWIGQALTGQGTSAPNTRWAKQITVTITWKGGGTNPGTFTTHTVCATP